jgi:hypothetical protein
VWRQFRSQCIDVESSCACFWGDATDRCVARVRSPHGAVRGPHATNGESTESDIPKRIFCVYVEVTTVRITPCQEHLVKCKRTRSTACQTLQLVHFAEILSTVEGCSRVLSKLVSHACGLPTGCTQKLYAGILHDSCKSWIRARHHREELLCSLTRLDQVLGRLGGPDKSRRLEARAAVTLLR